MISDLFREYVGSPIRNLLFPETCITCGHSTTQAEARFCVSCACSFFDDPNPQQKRSCDDIFLPNWVTFQDARFAFDKGGGMQALMHELKYKEFTRLGERMGKVIGARLPDNPYFRRYFRIHKSSLLPVPLHPNKHKQRGYNQAAVIAKGVKEVTGISMLESEAVKRVSNTKSQTGFTRKERTENINNAFQADPNYISTTSVIIIDDVFTTGATTFELARTVHQAGVTNIGVLTAAQA